MTANDVGQIVDKLAEKIGVAADKLAPIAEETVRQMSMIGVVYMLGAFMCLTLLAIFAYVMFRLGTKRILNAEEITVFSLIVGGILLGFSIGLSCYGLSLWIAPLPHILGL